MINPIMESFVPKKSSQVCKNREIRGSVKKDREEVR
jgi:hypothetical protein